MNYATHELRRAMQIMREEVGLAAVCHQPVANSQQIGIYHQTGREWYIDISHQPK
jgi:hypothetical protein